MYVFMFYLFFSLLYVLLYQLHINNL